MIGQPLRRIPSSEQEWQGLRLSQAAPTRITIKERAIALLTARLSHLVNSGDIAALILPIPEAPPPKEESAVFAGGEGHDIGAAANQIHDLVSQRQRGQKAQISSFRSREPPLLSEAQGQPCTYADADQGEEHPKKVTLNGRGASRPPKPEKGKR